MNKTNKIASEDGTSQNLIQEVKFLINLLPKRTQSILSRRFGLFNKKKETLESIGSFYNITRERVRQIQDHGINVLKVKILPANQVRFKKRFDVINQKIEEFGNVVSEEYLLNHLKRKEEDMNYLKFLLVLNSNIICFNENNDFRSRWALANKKNEVFAVENALKSLFSLINKEEVLSFDEVLKRFQTKLKNNLNTDTVLSLNADAAKQTFASWLGLTKTIGRNIFGEWGLSSSCHVYPKGIKDHAYLTMRRHGSPMHFREVSKAIQDNFKKPAHIQTVHNELIKDDRFVLVGRGLYALKEWGYVPGSVRDVISHIIKTHGRILREDLIKKLLKERHVKETTVAINLQNKNLFRKFPDGTYGLT